MVVVVGAGPAGLAVAYHLQKRNIPYLVLEKGRIGSAWRHHYESLRLHTLKAVSALPGRPMPADYPSFPSRQQFVDYLVAYAAYFNLKIQEETAVTKASFQAGKWLIETAAEKLSAQHLVAATGIWSTPYCPPFAHEDLFQGNILHASGYQNAAAFVGQRVLVIGAGNTGAEIAVEVSEGAAQTDILAIEGVTFVPYPKSALGVRIAAWFLRHAPISFGDRLLRQLRPNFAHLGLPLPNRNLTQVYPVVGFKLPQAVEAGKVQVVKSGVRTFTYNGVVFEDGREASYDSVILATGYRPTLSFVPDGVAFDEMRRPIVNRHFQSLHNPNLYCIGYSYPNVEGWLQALPRRAAVVARHIGRRY